MKIKSSVLSLAAAVALVGGGLSVQLASAHLAEGVGSSAGLVARIAEKFNLKTEDVQQVFDEERSAHQAEMQQRRADTLTQAVADGKLTEAQKDALMAKEEEMKSRREEARKLTDETQRRAALAAIRTEMTQWAADNGIDLQTLRPHTGRGGQGQGQGRGRGMGMM